MPSQVESDLFSRIAGGLAQRVLGASPFLGGAGKHQQVTMLTADRVAAADRMPLADNRFADGVADLVDTYASTPDELFNSTLIVLGVTIATMRAAQHIHKRRARSRKSEHDDANDEDKTPATKKKVKPPSVLSLQLRFLPVFWMIRLAYWMSGPYFYKVYASKVFDGEAASPTLISQIFLVGYGSIAVFGPVMGRALDQHGRKRGTVAAAVVYSLGALSALSDTLWVLLAGRAVGGVGTNGLSSAPEAWLVSEALGSGDDPGGVYLRETFGLAYSYDPVVAIASGQIAGYAARREGPTGPFKLLPVFLALGSLIAILCWKENRAKPSGEGDKKSTATVQEGFSKILEDKKLLMLGAVQSLFESSMYIFVSQWPPAMTVAVRKFYGKGAEVPFGTLFSCFMACCMLGSTFFAQFAASGKSIERQANFMLVVAALSMAAATYVTANSMDLAGLVLSFFAFEACVGMYFPMLGTMRSKYLPDCHRSVIMSLFSIPLNILVVTVFLFAGKLGTKGALFVATAALALAAVCMFLLRQIRSREAKRNLKRLVRKQMFVKMFTDSIGHQDRNGDANEIDLSMSFRFDVPHL